MKDNALVVNMDGTVVQLNARQAFSEVNKPNMDSGVKSRFMNLFTAVKSHVQSKLAIAVSMDEIETAKDYKLFGYKSTAEMCESMFEYKKATTSKMISVSRYFITRKDNGDLTTVFGDVSTFNLAELLQDKKVMQNMGDALVEFYKNFPIAEMKQAEIRALKDNVKNIIATNLPLTMDSYNNIRALEDKKSFVNETSDKVKKDDKTKENEVENSVSPIDKVNMYLSSISEIYDKLDNEQRKSVVDTLKMFTETLETE